MFKQLSVALMLVGTMATSVTLNPPAQATAGAAPSALVCDNTRDNPYTGTYSSVRVPKGASCYLRNALVTGNFKALHGARNVFIISTEVQRNIHIRGAERRVKIGTADCRLDPPVGNNIYVTRSHNVAICLMTVGNNIKVTRNDGRITLRGNVVGRSILVTDNLPYDRKPGDGHHRRIAAIRLINNVAGSHIVEKRNPQRGLIARNNSPSPTT